MTMSKNAIAGTALVVVLGAAALGAGIWWRGGRVAPPLPNFPAEVDPEVAEMVTAAQQEVLKQPSSSEAWGYYGKVLMAHDFRDEALFSLREAERLNPNEARWPYYQGLILLIDKK